MEKTWRLILDEARDPYLNMAIDEAIMLRQSEGGSTPTLRVYKWLYPCVTIGRFQYLESSLRAERSNLDCFGANAPRNDRIVIPRPTGGGAVAHNELSFTYSLIYREDSGAIPRGVLNSYKEIHSGVIEALKRLGIEAGFYPPSPERRLEVDRLRRTACFSSPVEYDIICGGRKMAGAAQRRKFGVVLHQGEVSLGLDVWSKWSYNNVLIAFTNGLSEHLKAEFLKGQISDRERSLAEELVAEYMEEVNR